jgi:alkylation response protein AidB-like acyl-CoA dehydrogenase
MDFSLPATAEEFAEEVREFVAEHVTDEVVTRYLQTGTMHDWGLHQALADRGWIAPTWPKLDGGQALSEIEAMVLLDQLHRAGAPLDGWIITMCGASAIRALGSAQQRAEVVPQVVAGQALISLGFSEPDSGSDVAAARTRAVRDGDEWIINGQKMFTTMAHEATWVLLLTRTDPSAAKHRGLTMFLVPLDSPGIVVEPVHTLGGERTNITFYADVRVPDTARVHELNKGWELLTLALTTERGSAFGAGSSFLGTMGRMLDGTLRWAATARRGGRPILEEPTARRRLAKAKIDHEVSRLLNLRSVWLAGQDIVPDVEASVAKLFSTEALQRMTSDLLELIGPEGLLNHHSPAAPSGGAMEHAFRHSTVTTIYGGSSEVMRNIISQRGLGLPRG